MKFTRRFYLNAAFALAALAAVVRFMRGTAVESPGYAAKGSQPSLAPNRVPLGIDEDGFSRVFVVRNGAPAENMARILQMMGGIERFVGPTDIVVLKPNAQWWNQGTTNTDAMKGFIDAVLAVQGFAGEVIIADNHQSDGDNSRGWNTDKRNGTFNLNELVEHYHSMGHANVTKYHWHVAGTTSLPLQGGAQGNSRVNGPQDGDGYVWLEDNYYVSPAGRTCFMTYPVFTSSYSGTTVDLKRGAWKDGQWLNDTRVRFINFSALNHHGSDCGVTASVKNLMGVVDMSCGWPGDKPDGTFNAHHIGVSKINSWKKSKLFMSLAARLGFQGAFDRYCCRHFHHTGGVLGHFMKNVRMPDLNITAAEWVGWGSRTETDKASREKTILASTDPVALDYVSARDVVLPVTPPELPYYNTSATYYELNDPEMVGGPLYDFLNETARQGIGNFNSNKTRIVSYIHS
jgi:hypothetical protein